MKTTKLIVIAIATILQTAAHAQSETQSLANRLADLNQQLTHAHSREEQEVLINEIGMLAAEVSRIVPAPRPGHIRPATNTILTVKADKLSAGRHNLDILGHYSKIIIRCVGGEVVFENQPRLIAMSEERVELQFYRHSLRAGEEVEIDLGHFTFDRLRGQHYQETQAIRSLILDIYSPNLIGSRGKLEIELVP